MIDDKQITQIALSSVSEILRRKRQEHLTENNKVDAILKEVHDTKEKPKKGYREKLDSLSREIRILEQAIDTIRNEA